MGSIRYPAFAGHSTIYQGKCADRQAPLAMWFYVRVRVWPVDTSGILYFVLFMYAKNVQYIFILRYRFSTKFNVEFRNKLMQNYLIVHITNYVNKHNTLR